MTTIPKDINVSKLDAATAFDGLTPTEKLYAYGIAKASWEGAKICLLQCSYEAPAIFTLLQVVLASETADPSLQALKAASGVGDDAWADFLTWAAAFFANMGNFKSFGDVKILPAIPAEEMHKILTAGEAYTSKGHAALIDELWDALREIIYSTDPAKELGFPPQGTTGYYSSNAMKADAAAVQAYLDGNNISAYNTRLFKSTSEDGGAAFIVRQAAAEAADAGSIEAEPLEGGGSVKVVPGDYAPLMARVVAALEEAKAHAANAEQEGMLAKYVESFATGSIEAHKAGSRLWVQDKGPAVESYIGFIESYRDPYGSRGEWEGFVAVVNRAMSEKFNTLVESAEEMLPLLPWPKEFEKDRFLRPDFTSLDVLAFASSGIPAGINIPNYDDLRQNEGFKNVSLGNVLAASMAAKSITFLREENGDEALYKELVKESFEVQVGLHELLGHGSGKLLCQAEDGSFNFEQAATIDPLTGQPAAGFYKPGETWDSKFPVFGSSYEECRAECVGIYLCTNQKVLSIFGHEGQKADDIKYINWLNMCRAGLLALEFYSPETQSWKQAHMQARFGILRVLLEAGEGFVTIAEHPEKGVTVSIDRSKIETVGMPAIEVFLRRIQIYKSTADFDSAKAMYVDGYTKMTPEMLKLRPIILEKKKERPLFVQPHLVKDGDEVRLQEFPATVEGVVQSFAARYPALDEELLALWRQDKEAMAPRPVGDGPGDAKRHKGENGGNGNVAA